MEMPWAQQTISHFLSRCWPKSRARRRPNTARVDEVLTDAVKRYVEERSWAKLLGYGAERAKALGVKESDVDGLIAESRAEQRGH